jgi:hypothetical protein
MRGSERASCSNLSYRAATLSPHPEEHRAAMRLEDGNLPCRCPIETALRASSG